MVSMETLKSSLKPEKKIKKGSPNNRSREEDHWLVFLSLLIKQIGILRLNNLVISTMHPIFLNIPRRNSISGCFLLETLSSFPWYGYVFLPNGDTVDGQNSIRPTWLGVVNHPFKGDEEEISVGNLPASWAGDCITKGDLTPKAQQKHHLPLHEKIEVTR